MNFTKKLISLALCFIMLFSSLAVLADTTISTYSNGNEVQTGFADGIFTAKSVGTGLFAIAMYKQSELMEIKLAKTDDAIENQSLNAVISSDDIDKIKVFRFDEAGNPLCINTSLVPTEKNYRIYVNEDFGDESSYNYTGGYVCVSDGRLSVTGAGDASKAGPRATFSAFCLDDKIVAEADFWLDEGDSAKLICGYIGAPRDFVRVSKGAICTDNGKTLLCSKDDIDYANPVNIAVMINLADYNFDVYINRKKANEAAIGLDGIVSKGAEDITFCIPNVHGENTCTVYADNIKIYSGDEPLDIGTKRANVHRYDFSAEKENLTVYERPSAELIAEKVMQTYRPRIMINKDRADELISSDNPELEKMRKAILELADIALGSDAFDYYINADDSIEYLSESAELMMALGLAYMIKGEAKYPQRAYKEAEQIITKYPNWGTAKALDVGEISFILAICYDWMYDGLSSAQREEIAASVMENSIYPSYKTYHGRYEGIEVDGSNWWKSTNNWNAICNGGAFMASVAFMEKDAFVCANLAEGTLRGLEILMANFAPDGAWTEGAGYWAYAMKFLTAAMATLKANTGELYGIDEAEGFSHTADYSLGLEGKAGVLNYGDASLKHINTPFALYWSKEFKNSEYTASAIYAREKYGFTITPYDFIYYYPEMDEGNGFSAPISFYYKGTELVTFASDLTNDASLVSMSGGKGNATGHDHLDSGAVIVDMRGERVLWDIGAEHYKAGGYFGGQRFLHFRARPESHNIFIIDPENTSDGADVYYGQDTDAISEIDTDTLDKTGKKATMKLTDAYARDVSDASRAISLDGTKVVIEDTMTLNGEGKDVYWNWYLKKDADGDVDITIDKENKTATLTQNGKTFVFGFTGSAISDIYIEAAEYYVNVDPDPNGRKHKNTDYMRLVVKMGSAAGTVSLKTVIE